MGLLPGKAFMDTLVINEAGPGLLADARTKASNGIILGDPLFRAAASSCSRGMTLKYSIRLLARHAS